MSQLRVRVMSSLIGLVILAVAFVVFDTYLFNLIMAIVSMMAVQELFAAMGAAKTTSEEESMRLFAYRPEYRGFVIIAVIFSLMFAFAKEAALWQRLPQAVFVLLLVFFLLILKNHQSVRFEQASMIFLFSILIPLGFACAVYIRCQFGDVLGRYYLLMGLGAAWLSDTGAYFTGMKFGRRKLAPVISPKKTVEGVIGGAITATLLMCVLAFAYSQIAGALGVNMRVNYAVILLAMPFLSLAGVLGDLTMSSIKRQFGIKDYGTIMPGHGGILDRFDSVLFTLPSVYILIQYFPVVFLV